MPRPCQQHRGTMRELHYPQDPFPPLQQRLLGLLLLHHQPGIVITLLGHDQLLRLPVADQVAHDQRYMPLATQHHRTGPLFSSSRRNGHVFCISSDLLATALLRRRVSPSFVHALP